MRSGPTSCCTPAPTPRSTPASPIRTPRSPSTPSAPATSPRRRSASGPIWSTSRPTTCSTERSDRPYVEWDQPNPRSVYGRSKLGGELEVHAAAGPSATVVRTAWVSGAHGANMVKTVLRLAADNPRGPLRFVDDQHGCPTFTADLARAVVRLALDRRPGTFHVTNQGETTWFGFARAALAAAGLDPDVRRTHRHRRARSTPARAPTGQFEARQRRPPAVGPSPAAPLDGFAGPAGRFPLLRRLGGGEHGVGRGMGPMCFRTGENDREVEGPARARNGTETMTGADQR